MEIVTVGTHQCKILEFTLKNIFVDVKRISLPEPGSSAFPPIFNIGTLVELEPFGDKGKPKNYLRRGHFNMDDDRC